YTSFRIPIPHRHSICDSPFRKRPADRKRRSVWDSTRLSPEEPAMRSAVAMVGDGFNSPSREQAGSVDELLAPTWRTPEAAPAYRRAARAGEEGWPTLPGYEILGEVGRGGMAVVYKARPLRRQRIVAIKVSNPGLSGESDVVARFRREQALAARLTHPNLVAAYDAGQVAGVPYLVLEFVEGHDLAWLVGQRGPLPAAEACEVVRQAALGLQHLHKQGLGHRGVQPANLK